MIAWRSSGTAFLACALSCSGWFGCALTSKAEALSPRYFSPESRAEPRSAPAPNAYELRLGEVSSASHLDDRIAYRVGASEMGFYDDQRWTENPEAYLRRALERDLFEERGLSRIVTGSAPILDVELINFEEVRGARPTVRVTLTFMLRDDRRSFVERTLNLDRPVAPRASVDPAQRLAETLTATLDEAVRQLGDEVVAKLAANAGTRASPP